MYGKLALGNIRKSVKDFGIYFVTVVLGVALFYAFNSMTSSKGVLALTETQSRMLDLLGIILNAVSVFIGIVLVFLIVYANRFLIRRRKKEFSLYLILGMRPSGVSRIVLIETLLVGIVSLAVGLGLGILLSQALVALTAILFDAGYTVAETGGIALVFSADTAWMTVALFAAVFAIAAAFNTGSVAKAKLIDLMNTSRKTEVAHLTHLGLALGLFIVSLVCIGVAYYLLIENGLMELGPQFALSTALMVVGTFLFFYSLAGFLLKLLQTIKPLYFKNLNMFLLRQLNAKVNSTFFTLSLVCITLFLALTSVSGGIGIRTALDNSLEGSTNYSISATTYWGDYNASEGFQSDVPEPFEEYAASVNYAMAEGLAQSGETLGVGNFLDDAEGYAQIDLLVDESNPLTMGALEEASGTILRDFAGSTLNGDYAQYPVYLAKESEVNAALELAGLEPLELSNGEYAIFSDANLTRGFYDRVLQHQTEITVDGISLMPVGFYDTSLQTTPFPLNTGTIVVPDSVIPADAQRLQSILNVQTTDENESVVENLFTTIQDSDNEQTWPLNNVISRTLVFEQSIGLSTIIAFIAIYLGFVLVMACAAILAIQQLSDASDNAHRYGLLQKLGAPEPMIRRALFTQILVYFLFPLILAIAHTICALSVVTDVVSIFGHLEIGEMTLYCALGFLLLYGLYFAITYLGARKFALLNINF